jgi:hypothetical protein
MVKKILLKFWVDLKTYEKLILKKGEEKDWQNFLTEIVNSFLSGENVKEKSEKEPIKTEKVEIKTAAEIVEQKQTSVQIPAPGPVSTTAVPGPVKEEKKEEKPISEELYEVVYEGKKYAVAEYKSFEDRTELYPVIPVSSKLWHSFLAKQADKLGIKAEAVEEEGNIIKMVFYKKEGVSEQDKQMFKQSVDWVFRTALKNIPK